MMEREWISGEQAEQIWPTQLCGCFFCKKAEFKERLSTISADLDAGDYWFLKNLLKYGEEIYGKCHRDTKWANLSEELEELQGKRINQDLMDLVKEVHAENAALKTKLSRLDKVLGYDGSIVKPILYAIKILNNEEVEDE